MNRRLKLWQKILIAVILLVAVGVALFLLWASNVAQADPKKLSEFYDKNANLVVVKEYPNYWEIAPKNTECKDENCARGQGTGIIFYPGAKIDPRAYFYKLDFLANGAPLKTNLYITKPPLYLAVFGIYQADEIIRNNPDIENWIIGGHSLGGAMTCEYMRNTHAKVSQLILLGSYCGSSVRDSGVKVVTIHGSEDGVMSPQKVRENNKNLPSTFKEFIISGMNHAQAGNYGNQDGDNSAKKSDEDVKMEIESILGNEIH